LVEARDALQVIHQVADAFADEVKQLCANGESLFWEDAVQVIANQIRESRER
jgi:hypothetical protein